MDNYTTKMILTRYYPAGIDVRTTSFFARKGIPEEQLKLCRDNGLLSLKNNQGVWVYQITPKGIEVRDSVK